MADILPSYFDLIPHSSVASDISLDSPTGSLDCHAEGSSSWPGMYDAISSSTAPFQAWSYPKSTTFAPPKKRVRNRNTVRLDCEPCKRTFTRICVYKAHLKTRKHAVNHALINVGTSLHQTTAPASLDCGSQTSPPPSDNSGSYSLAAVNPSAQSGSDPMDFDFSNFDWITSSDYSISDSDSQASVITPPPQWITLPEAPLEATLTVIGTSSHAIKGFYLPSTNLFIPS
ncbi:hypothetical protein BDZ94DRAFT_1244039 [Collybia nuda]|uniref:C2H2-type domain-containing protein n=1 Tax=Collybia nuda TaxID=64659 RepID=A0A9P6CJV7_9AGAR|nr:hypothetical protein BDZ94DRAFT_1244039 [Collybia nuda]